MDHNAIYACANAAAQIKTKGHTPHYCMTFKSRMLAYIQGYKKTSVMCSVSEVKMIRRRLKTISLKFVTGSGQKERLKIMIGRFYSELQWTFLW
jgi:hypothetical protein